MIGYFSLTLTSLRNCDFILSSVRLPSMSQPKWTCLHVAHGEVELFLFIFALVMNKAICSVNPIWKSGSRQSYCSNALCSICGYWWMAKVNRLNEIPLICTFWRIIQSPDKHQCSICTGIASDVTELMLQHVLPFSVFPGFTPLDSFAECSKGKEFTINPPEQGLGVDKGEV